MKLFTLAMLTVAANCVSQGVTQTEAGYSGQTRTLVNYGAQDLEVLQGGIDTWFDSIAKPFIKDHRSLVRDAALAELESERGQLLATCDEGTKCRAENEKVIRQQMQKEWAEVMKSFRKDVNTTVLRSKEIVASGWDNAVQCEIDHPCCTVSETVWNNLMIQIEQTESLLAQKRSHLLEIQLNRCELETACDKVDFPTEVGADYYAPDCSGESVESEPLTQTLHVDDLNGPEMDSVVTVDQEGSQDLQPVKKAVVQPQTSTIVHVDDLNGAEMDSVASVNQAGGQVAQPQTEAVVHVDDLNGPEMDSVTTVNQAGGQVVQPQTEAVIHVDDLNGAEMDSVTKVDKEVQKEVKPAEDIELGGCHVYQGSQASKQLGQIKSITWDNPIKIKFKNNSSQQLAVYWIDYQGEPVFYSNVKAGGVYDMNSYVTHPWAIYTSDGQIQLIEVVSEKVPNNTQFVFDLSEQSGRIYAEISKK